MGSIIAYNGDSGMRLWVARAPLLSMLELTEPGGARTLPLKARLANLEDSLGKDKRVYFSCFIIS